MAANCLHIIGGSSCVKTTGLRKHMDVAIAKHITIYKLVWCDLKKISVSPLSLNWGGHVIPSVCMDDFDKKIKMSKEFGVSEAITADHVVHMLSLRVCEK